MLFVLAKTLSNALRSTGRLCWRCVFVCYGFAHLAWYFVTIKSGSCWPCPMIGSRLKLMNSMKKMVEMMVIIMVAVIITVMVIITVTVMALSGTVMMAMTAIQIRVDSLQRTFAFPAQHVDP
jgi:hypothetical protein